MHRKLVVGSGSGAGEDLASTAMRLILQRGTEITQNTYSSLLAASISELLAACGG